MIWEDGCSKIDTNLRFEIPPHSLPRFLSLSLKNFSHPLKLVRSKIIGSLKSFRQDHPKASPTWSLPMLKRFSSQVDCSILPYHQYVLRTSNVQIAAALRQTSGSKSLGPFVFIRARGFGGSQIRESKDDRCGT